MDLVELEHPPVSRVARKRQQARARILDAAERLMRERGFDAVKIQDITDAADVGHGTFYTHFKTKMDVLVPIVRAKAQQVTEQLDALTKDMTDPAYVVSISVRHMLLEICNDPLWTWFLVKSELPMDQIRDASGESARRDIEKGIATGRFIDHDQATLEPFLLGAITGIIRGRFTQGIDQTMIDNCAYLLLLMLGVEKQEARNLCCTPLPPIPVD